MFTETVFPWHWRNELVNEGHAQGAFRRAVSQSNAEASIYSTARRKERPMLPLSKYVRLFQLQTPVLTPDLDRAGD
jgi:hypothetical protein